MTKQVTVIVHEPKMNNITILPMHLAQHRHRIGAKRLYTSEQEIAARARRLTGGWTILDVRAPHVDPLTDLAIATNNQ
jgi:hypothetical protein